jgi:hypothetical protein
MDFYKNTLFIVFVSIFAISAIITLLGISGVLKIERRYLNTLFTSLIVTLIGAVISVFNGMDWKQPPTPPLNQTQPIGPISDGPSSEDSTPGPKTDSSKPDVNDANPAKEDLKAVAGSPDLLRTFFVGRWAVEQRSGANSGGSVIEYNGDGRFNGEQTGFNGSFGMKQPISGDWTVEPTGSGSFRLTLIYDNGQPDFNGTFKIFDRDHIQNVDANYIASRVTN